MSASDHLNDIQFSVYTGGKDKIGSGAVYAHNGSTLYDHEGKVQRNTHNIIGKLQWGMEHEYNLGDGGPHEVDEVWVHPDHRRQGIANAMLGFAKSVASDIRPSNTRTEKGDAWAQAQGLPAVDQHIKWHDRFGDSPG